MAVIHTEGPVTSGLEPNIAQTPRRVWPAISRGLRCRCPACGKGSIFDGYLTVVEACTECGEPLHHHRADDFPPYVTIVLVGHIVVPAVLAVERLWRPEIWIHLIIWLPLTLILSLVLLRPVKGAVVGLQWALRMHGFDPNTADPDAAEPEPKPASVVISAR